MINNKNNKRERDTKNIVITLGKTDHGYYYYNDSLNERSKIKIPLMEMIKEDNYNFPVTSEHNDSKKDKSEKSSIRHNYQEENKADLNSKDGNQGKIMKFILQKVSKII